MNTISRLFTSALVLCGTAAAAQTSSVIRTQPEGVLKTYQRSGEAFYAYYGEPAMTDQDNTVINIVTAPDGKTIYMKDPISQANAGTWIKGSLGDDGKLHVPLGQCVQYFNMGYGWKTVVLRMGEYDDFVGATYYIDDEMQEVTFTYSADGSTITMDDLGGTDAGGYPGAMYALVYTDDESFVGYADYHSVYTPFTLTYTTLPDGVESDDWTFTYSNGQEGEFEKLPVAIEGDKFYLAGLSLHDPDATIVGTISPADGIEANQDATSENFDTAAADAALASGNFKVSFPSDQYVGHHSGFLLYAFGASYETKTFYDEAWDETYTTHVMTPEPTLDLYYDAATRTLSPRGDMALVLNMGRANDYGINYMSVSLDPKFEAPATFNPQSPDGITTAPSLFPASPTYYDLNGRRVGNPATNGVTIIRMQDGKTLKMITKH